MQIPARASLITGFVVLPNFGQYSFASVSIEFGFVVLVDLCSFLVGMFLEPIVVSFLMRFSRL